MDLNRVSPRVPPLSLSSPFRLSSLRVNSGGIKEESIKRARCFLYVGGLAARSVESSVIPSN